MFLAAGSLGSTELLLRCRDEHKTLPNLSRGARPELERERQRALDGHVRRCQQGSTDHRTHHLGRARLHGRELERSAVRHRGRRLSECAPERLARMPRSWCRDGRWTKCPPADRRARARRRALAQPDGLAGRGNGRRRRPAFAQEARARQEAESPGSSLEAGTVSIRGRVDPGSAREHDRRRPAAI